MRYITPLAEVTWEVWNRDNTFDAIYILYDVVPLRFHKGHQSLMLKKRLTLCAVFLPFSILKLGHDFILFGRSFTIFYSILNILNYV